MSRAPAKISFSRRSEDSIGASGTGGVYHIMLRPPPGCASRRRISRPPAPLRTLRGLPRPESVEEPGSSEGPVAVGAPPADPERESGLAQGQPGEQAKLDQLGGTSVNLREPGECLVEVDQIIGRRIVGEQAVEIERRAAPAPAALEPLSVAGTIKHDSPHGLRRGGEEVAATVPGLARIRPDDTEVGLVNQRRGLECLPRTLLR